MNANEVYAILNGKIKAGPYGSPLVATTVAGMTDHNRVYVYTGDEDGYTAGNWYYWNGTAWTSGGVYNATAVVTDTTLTESGVPADAEATGAAIDALKEDLNQKANADGSYENMKVGLAENLDPTVFIEDIAAYTFRTSGGNNDIGEFERLSEITGGSIAWNQLSYPKNQSQNGMTSTKNDADGTFTLSNVATGSYINCIGGTGGPAGFVENHIYYEQLDVIANPNSVYFKAGSLNGKLTQVDTTKPRGVFKAASSGNVSFGLASIVTGTDVTGIKARFNLIDITAMFGSTIADYIFALETATAGDGVAWFKRYFPKDFYAYCAPHFEHTQVEAHETVGFNQWDEEWETGTISSGVNSNSSVTLRSKNYIPCLPVTTYYFSGPNNKDKYVFFYDSDKSYIGVVTNIKTPNTFVTPENAKYMRFVYTYYIQDYTTYNHDICINLHWDGSRDGEYEPYDKRSYPLDDVVLRGIPKIDASGNLYFEGDTYKSDGTVNVIYIEKVLDGSNDETWSTKTNISNAYSFEDDSIANNSGSVNAISDIRCSKYDVSSQTAIATGTADKAIAWFGWGKQLVIRDSAYESLADFKSALALNPITVVYPIAIPTTEEADPFMETQWVNDFGTERFVPASSLTRDVEIPVGHVTKYPPDLKAKVEMSPNSPPSNGLWLVQHEDGVNTYVQYLGELPADPSEDGAYYLKATRASGTTTLSWEEAQE